MASEPFVNQMRRGNVHVNASRKTFKNIYARFHTFHHMGASQIARSLLQQATLLVVTFSRDSYREDPGGEAAPKILPRPGGGVAAPKILPTENSSCPPASRFIYFL